MSTSTLAPTRTRPRKACVRAGCLGLVEQLGDDQAAEDLFAVTDVCSVDCAAQVHPRTEVDVHGRPTATRPCARRSCERRFVPRPGRSSGPRQQIYCSPQCRHADRSESTLVDGAAPSKPCERAACEQRIVQRGGRVVEYTRARFCSTSCKRLHHRALRDATTKPCARAGCEGLVRLGVEGRPAFERQRFCSARCNAIDRSAARALPVQRKRCARAGCEGVVEGVGVRFERQRFCSRRCSALVNFTLSALPDESESKECAGPGCRDRIYLTGRGRAYYERQQFCSRQCSAGARQLGVGATRVERKRERRAAERVVRPAAPGLTVFGDRPPPAPWRPAGFSARPNISSTTLGHPNPVLEVASDDEESSAA